MTVRDALAFAIFFFGGWTAWRLLRVVENINTEIKQMSPQVQKLTQDVAAMRDVNQSAVALLSGLSQQLKDALAQARDNDDMTALEALSSDLESQTQALAGAVTANTAGTPPTP